jgi:hypothetical protein
MISAPSAELLPEAALLPASLREMAAVTGYEAVMRLVAAYGGVRAPYVPAAMPAEHPYVRLLGAEAAAALAAQYGGSEYLAIPRCARLAETLRRRAIETQAAAGWTLDRIARHHGLSRRRVQQILAGRADRTQTDMFET